jgi:hypothetical protein
MVGNKFTVIKCEDCTYWNTGNTTMGCQIHFNNLCKKIGHTYYVNFSVEEYRAIRDNWELGKQLQHYPSEGS